MIVIMGTTQSFVQQRISFLALEKRIQRLEANRRSADGLQRFMGKNWDCLKTLEKKKLSGSAGDAKRSFEIAAVKESGGSNVWDFAKNAAGELTAAATKERLKGLGVDKFEKLEFVYESASPAAGRIVLTSKTNIPGLLEGKNPDIVWKLSGITVEDKTAAEAAAESLTEGAGDYVTACASEAMAAKGPCGGGVAGAFHINPNGSKGGFVAATATVESTAFIGPNAAVCDTAQVRDTARVYDNAKVYGEARVYGKARVYGNAQVYDKGQVSDNAWVFGFARVFWKARVYKKARVYGSAEISGEAWVKDNARVYENGRVYSKSQVREHGEVYGEAQVYGEARVYGSARIYGSARTRDDGKIFGNARVYGNALVYETAKVYGAVKVFGGARIGELARALGDAELSGDAGVFGTHVCRGKHSSGRIATQHCSAPFP